ncbi:hypothetical protein N3K66_000020 [Trichothecium roseum]|uniref:Uncharacterized protein n=1 Tax=Trichothecium roseum TaxID=47278 RepID=A0ACC0VAL9_9HYPO|nr:hypothetical protein N3K66_000020 [Trichothecium roseum]
MSAVRAQMGSRQIVDVSPVTGFQRHVIDMSLLWPRQALNYLYIDFGLDLNLDQLKSSCRSLMNRFSLLRSAFVQAQDSWFQVSLKDVALPFKVMAANEDLLSVSYDICLEDTGTGFKSGAVPTYFWLVQNETQGSRLIVRLSHTQYDGVSLPVLLGSLFDSYEGRTLKPITPYAEFLSFKQSQRSASYAYWDKLLKGSKMTEISQLLLPDTRRPSAFEVASHRILFEDTVSIAQLPEKVTLASAISSAWAFVLSELTRSRDIVYGSLVTGRGVNMPDIENVVGPCVNMVPVRARLSPQQTAHSLFLSIQEQNLVAQEHAVGLQDIQNNVGWAVGSDFESVVQHQGVDETPGFQLSNGSVKVGWFDSPYYFPPRLLVMSYPMAGGVRIKLHANSHIVSVDMAETLLSSLCKALKMLIASHDKPLSHSKLAGHSM